MSEKTFNFLFPFGGSGLGAYGFQKAATRVLGIEGRIRVLGGIDNDPAACADFTYLTGAPALCADVRTLNPHTLLEFTRGERLDGVFASAPCTGASPLLPPEKAQTEHYQQMNELGLQWLELQFQTWRDDDAPSIILFENVPLLTQRSKVMIRSIEKLLRSHGYVLHQGKHCCGKLGGLAQLRTRWLLLARLAKRVRSLVYQPPPRRVRGVGEVLGPLPLPNDPAAGPMHTLPKITLLNWLRLAMIPPGGDWSDLPTKLELEAMHQRVRPRESTFVGAYGVLRWEEPSGVVTRALSPSMGSFSVADPRLCPSVSWHPNVYGVLAWDEPAHTVTGAAQCNTGAFSVADGRLRPKKAYPHTWGVLRWDRPSHTVTGALGAGVGPVNVADPRLARPEREYGSGPYGVLAWEGPAKTVTGNSAVTTGSFSVADGRMVGTPHLHTDPRVPGCQIVADPRVPGNPSLALRFYPRNIMSPVPFVPVFTTVDGSWHRPMTTLELAILMGLDATHKGAPLVLHGTSHTGWRQRIGNGVPVGTAEAIANQVLLTLMNSTLGVGALSMDPVWVAPVRPHHFDA